MRKRATGIALTLVVLASMSLTLGAGMRWAARLKVSSTIPVINIVPSITIETSGDQTSGIDVVVTSDGSSSDGSSSDGSSTAGDQ